MADALDLGSSTARRAGSSPASPTNDRAGCSRRITESGNDMADKESTDMTEELDQEVQDAIKMQIPLGRLGSPEDVAASVAFFVSPGGDYLTGQTLHVNGGMYMGN